ncbi:hypothetical protein ACLUWS_05785 [Bifidobacterium boum]|uniref:hypothetical protein n=1 Tax=Bifidobacterium boum TaxID=78343 RepID=UPI003995E78F
MAAMNRRTIPQDRRELYACRPRRNVDGIAIITGRQDQDGWSLFEGAKYYLVETQAPRRGISSAATKSTSR